MEEERDSLQKFLSGRDTDCPKCGYNLRDLQGFVCPECGEFITIESLEPIQPTTWVQDFVWAIHKLNICVIGFVGVCTGLMFLARLLSQGTWGFSPEIVFLSCLVAAAGEFSKIPELFRATPAWAWAFNPVTYFSFFAGLAIGTSYLGFM